jgi:hypothetical protein
MYEYGVFKIYNIILLHSPKSTVFIVLLENIVNLIEMLLM